MGTPAKTSDQQARVTVRVTRNKNTPQWAGTPYSVSINENQGSNTKIYQVRAEDRDPDGPFKQLFYSIIGDDAAPAFFAISSDTGDISVRRDLKETEQEVFSVSLLYYFKLY